MANIKDSLAQAEIDAIQAECFRDFRDDDLRRASALLTKLHYATDIDDRQEASDALADHFANLISQLHNCECTREDVYKGRLK